MCLIVVATPVRAVNPISSHPIFHQVTQNDVNVEKVSEFWNSQMTSLVLAASNHASFNSSIWSAWAGAPHDLLLVSEASICVVFVVMKYAQDETFEAYIVESFYPSRQLQYFAGFTFLAVQ